MIIKKTNTSFSLCQPFRTVEDSPHLPGQDTPVDNKTVQLRARQTPVDKNKLMGSTLDWLILWLKIELINFLSRLKWSSFGFEI